MNNQRGSEHNKKRNAGLLYEFLVREISRALVEQDHSRGTKALKILKRWYKPTTQLYREFRLANSLLKTHVSSQGIAVNILTEAKNAVRTIDYNKLAREKSLLIKDINHGLGGGQFWEQRIPNYKQWATIQTLFNDWAAKQPNIQRIGEYEDQIVGWLTETKQVAENTSSEMSAGDQKLVLSIMEKKINDKWGKTLTPIQKELVREWALYSTSDDVAGVTARLKIIKNDLLGAVKSYRLTEGRDNKILSEKLEKIQDRVLSENLEQINDTLISRFMMYTQLIDEINSED